jgi:hypothetical protein
MVKFSKKLKPIFIDNSELVRLGSIDDGGYVVPKVTVKSSNLLISMGISDNWDFEKDFRKNSNAKILAFDYSINKNFWISKFKKDLIKFIQLKIFKPRKLYKMFQYIDFLIFFRLNKNIQFFLEKIGKNKDSISLDKIIKKYTQDQKEIFLKIDIENYEYEIIDEIILYKGKIQGIVIEFHSISKNLEKIYNFINKLKSDLELVHIHINNYSVKEIGQFPEAIELTFSRKNLHDQNLINNKDYPIKNLDFPNSKRSNDIKISFVE